VCPKKVDHYTECAHKHPKKSIVDAILYVLRGGIQWRMMPKAPPEKPFMITSANGTSGVFGKID
jgi:hypothetical protein